MINTENNTEELQAYEMWLDGDNFLGIAIAKSKERALEITPSFFKDKVVARSTKKVNDLSTERFIKIDHLDDSTVSAMGYKSKDALSLGIWW